MSEKFFKTGEVANFFGVTVRTIKNWRKSGKLIPVTYNERGYSLYSYTQIKNLKKCIDNHQKISTNKKKSVQSNTPVQGNAPVHSNAPVHGNTTTDDNFNKNFGKILQGKPTNALTFTSGKRVTSNLLDNAEIICNDVQIFIEQFSQVKLNVQTYKVFDACILKLTKNFPHGKNVTDETLLLHKDITISIDEYMTMTGLKDRKQAYQQLKDAMNTLYNISFKWEGKIFIKEMEHSTNYEIRLAEAMKSSSSTDTLTKVLARGSVTLSLSMKMARFLATAYIMPYPYNLLTINSHKNPHSYFIGRRLALHHNMNINKKNAFRISVMALIESLPDLPKYENIIRSNSRSVTQQIIQPFERDLMALEDTYGILKEWHYCNSNDEPITNKQAERYDYSTWIEWLISFEFNDYPSQSDSLSN